MPNFDTLSARALCDKATPQKAQTTYLGACRAAAELFPEALDEIERLRKLVDDLEKMLDQADIC